MISPPLFCSSLPPTAAGNTLTPASRADLNTGDCELIPELTGISPPPPSACARVGEVRDPPGRMQPAYLTPCSEVPEAVGREAAFEGPEATIVSAQPTATGILTLERGRVVRPLARAASYRRSRLIPPIAGPTFAVRGRRGW